jgi:WD40 repeat protein
VWNFLEKRQEAVLQGHISQVLSLAVTNDNNYIISGSGDNSVRVWNLFEKRQEAVFKGHTSVVSSVAVTSDNKYIISVSDDKTIRVWKFLEKKPEIFIENIVNPKNLAIENQNLVNHFGDC